MSLEEAVLLGLVCADFFTEAFERVSPFDFVQFVSRELVQELVHREEATAHLNDELSVFKAQVDAFAAEFVNSGGLSGEHDLEAASVRVVVDEICDLHVHRIFLHGYIDGHACLQVDDVPLECLSLRLKVVYLLEEV